MWLNINEVENVRERRIARMAKEVRLNKITLVVLVALGVVVSVYVIAKISRRGDYADEYIRLSELISASIDMAEQGGKRVVAVRNMDDEEIGRLSKGLTKEGKAEYVTVGDKVRLQGSYPLEIGGTRDKLYLHESSSPGSTHLVMDSTNGCRLSQSRLQSGSHGSYITNLGWVRTLM